MEHNCTQATCPMHAQHKSKIRCDQIIRSDGRIIRLIPANLLTDTTGCPKVTVKSDGRGYYQQVEPGTFDAFEAIDVTRKWEAR